MIFVQTNLIDRSFDFPAPVLKKMAFQYKKKIALPLGPRAALN